MFLGERNIDLRFVSACSVGHLLDVKKCLEQGADVNVGGGVALRYAAVHGHLEIIKYLIEQGADIHAWDDWALQLATARGYLQVANVLRKAAGDEYKCHNCIIKSTCLELCEDFRR
jgi:ankyrin repeat protein